MKNIFKDLKRRDHKRYLGGLDAFLNISVPDCWLLWGLLTRGTGHLILRQGLNLAIHCCGS